MSERHIVEQKHHKKKKFNIYETMIKSVLLYRCEMWRVTERSRKTLNAVEIDAIQRSMRIFRREKLK